MTVLAPRRAWVIWCLALYIAAVAVIVLSPVSYSDIVGAIGDWMRFDLGWTAFGYGWIEFFGNVALFVPFGFLLTMLFDRPWWGVALALAASAGIELVQTVIPDRQASVRDVISNTLGAAIGALVAWIILLIARRRRRGRATRV